MNKFHIKLILLFLLDLTIILLSFITASLLITNFNVDNSNIIDVFKNLHWILPVYAFSFVIFRFYRSLWRYASVEEAINVFLAVITSSILISRQSCNLSLQ